MAEPGLSVVQSRLPFLRPVDALLTAITRTRTRLLLQALLWLTLTAVLVLFATAGTLRFEHGMRYYDELGAAFLRGQLYLPEQPKSELLALSNPYDATQNTGLTLPDAALYKDHFYLYFGPTPAVIHAAWHVFTGLPLDDGVVEVGAALIASAAFWGILAHIRRSYAAKSPGWLVIAGAIAFAVGGLMLDLVGRPAVYHEAILVAMACMLAGGYMLVRALDAQRWQRALFLLVGLLLGCAVASRLTYLSYAFAVGVALAWRTLRAPRQERVRRAQDVAIFAAPLLGVGALLLLYNWARFDAPFEFGAAYQLAGINVPEAITCGPKYLPTYLALYLFAIPKLQPFFPFFLWDAGPGWGLTLPTQEQVPLARGMYMELPLLSPFLNQPIALLSLLFLPVGMLRGRALAPLVTTMSLALGVGFLATIPLLSCVYGINLRYFADLTPAVTLLGSIGLVLSYHWLSEPRPAGHRFSPRRSARVLLVSFAALSWSLSLAIGVLLGLGVWAFAYPEQMLQPRRVSNELWAGLNARLRPDTVRNWAEPTQPSTSRAGDGSYFDESTIYLRSTEPGSSLVLSLDWHATEPTQLVIQIDGLDRDEQTLQPGRHLVVSRPLATLPPDAVVGVRLSLPSAAGAQPGIALPLTVQRLYFTRGAAETAVYQTIATGIEQTPAASDELLASANEMLARQTLADTQAALLDTQAALLRTQAEVARLQNELKQPRGQSP